MAVHFPRLVIAAPKSGSGKTVITCGLLAAFLKRGLTCRAFKCGPDYIDPMFHQTVLGVEGCNLDTFFLEKEQIRELFAREAEGASVSLVEGVMGYYDGCGADTTLASTYETAGAIDAPVVLVVDGKGSSLSLAALVRGFLEYKEQSRIRGVIFNRTSKAMAERLRPAMEALGVRVYGCLPECEEGMLESRHLGLVLPEEAEKIRLGLWKLGDQAEACMDVDGLLALAREGDDDIATFTKKTIFEKKSIPIGIAKDLAFCFYYKENLRLLEEAGAELIPFSPLEDKSLPEGIRGLIFGGGYPELYCQTLSANRSMRQQIRQAAEEGMPIIAECGGFLYLLEELTENSGKTYPMAGVLKGRGFPAGKLCRFGYVEVSAQKDTLPLKKGECIRGHEFHYWDATSNGAAMKAVKPGRDIFWECIHGEGTIFAGFPHLYYPSAPQFVLRWVGACENWNAERKRG